MNNSTPTPPPSVPPSARLITPECQPVFPCWLYFRGTSIPSGWVRHGSASGPGWLARNGYTHWHPDQPEAPTVTPSEPKPSVPQAVPSLYDRYPGVFHEIFRVARWPHQGHRPVELTQAECVVIHDHLAAIAPHVAQAIQPGHTYAEWKQYQELEKLLDDTATLCRRLAHALPGHHPLRKSAVEYLQENDLMGSPLRATPPPLPASEQPKVTGETSDGYHTFNELYDHRCTLFLALMQSAPALSWISTKHEDGTSWDGWFIAGMKLPTGDVTYHLPARMWSLACETGAAILETGFHWDGHTSADVVKRVQAWITLPRAPTTAVLTRAKEALERADTALSEAHDVIEIPERSSDSTTALPAQGANAEIRSTLAVVRPVLSEITALLSSAAEKKEKEV
jgi:hypothetical protein